MSATVMSSRAVRVAVALVPEHSQMVQVLLCELLRIAGLTGGVVFETQTCSSDGRPVPASNGRIIGVDAALGEIVRPDAVIVCASYHPYDHLDRGLIAKLREFERHGALIGGLDTGTLVLAEAGLLDGRRATLHWDEIALARKQYPGVVFTGALVEQAPRRLTGCGSLGTIDFASALIAVLAGQAVADAVMDLTIHGRNESKLAMANPALAAAVTLMSENIDAPLSVSDIARQVNLSTRQLTRIFEREFGRGPGRFYQDMRLDHARDLVLRTRFSLSDIALSTGFASASWFSRAFRARFSQSPSQARSTGHSIPAFTHATKRGNR